MCFGSFGCGDDDGASRDAAIQADGNALEASLSDAGSASDGSVSDAGTQEDAAQDVGSPEDAAHDGAHDGGDVDALSTGYSRESLLVRRVGFGESAGGVGDGSADDALTWTEVRVQNTNPSGTGSLSDALSAGPRWITFAAGLSDTITDVGGNLPSRVVIDGRGASIAISPDQLRVINDTQNVIITNLAVDSGGTDGFRIRSSNHLTTGPRDIWLDHITFGSTGDECLDISAERETVADPARPRNITLSYLRFNADGVNRDFAILAGSANNVLNSPDFITMHHCYFDDMVERQPRVVAAQWHSFNNWHYGWGRNGAERSVSTSVGAHFLVENSVIDDLYGRTNFIWPNDGKIRASGNLLSSGVSIAEQDASEVFTPPYSYDSFLEPANQALRDKLESEAGRQ